MFRDSKIGFVVTLLFSCLTTNSYAQSVSAQFGPANMNNYGVTEIRVDGQNLLTGCGFGFIGSLTGTDDTGNITSCRQNNGGVMHPFNGASSPSLPFALTFRKDAADQGKLYFDGRIGPSAFPFKTVSMPMDAIRGFTYYRYAGSSAFGRYDNITYADPNKPPSAGANYITQAPGFPTWGEIIGTDITIRVTLTSRSRSMGLFFVEAPTLGVRNVEFSFGSVTQNQSATVAGYIQVFRTNPATLPAFVYQAETQLSHQIGRRDADGWSVRVGDPINQYMSYGPYVSTLPAGGTTLPTGRRTATFRLMLDNVTADNNRILTLDVFDANSGRSLKTMDITRRQFNTGAFSYKDFTLDFIAAPGQRLEFRTLWRGGSYVRQDSVVVR